LHTFFFGHSFHCHILPLCGYSPARRCSLTCDREYLSRVGYADLLWYGNEHYRDVLGVPGFVAAQRFRLAPVQYDQSGPDRPQAKGDVGKHPTNTCRYTSWKRMNWRASSRK